ncbi:putative reverse transcriptase domain-containing protein [Tanacetum coccineum]
MSPPIRRKYRDSVSFATGCKRIKNCKRCNRKIRIPIGMWSCRVEEKMILKEVNGKTVEEIETKIIAKEGTVTRVPGEFQGYETSEEEPFAPHRLPQPEGNMNGWLMEDEQELERNEVDSDLESTASSKPVWKKTTKADPDCASRGLASMITWIIVDALYKMAPSRRSGPNNDNENPDIAALIAQQLQTILPQIVTQVTNNVNNANNGNGGNGNGGNNGCTFKAFQSCNPKEYDGKGGAIALTWWNTQVQARGREAAMAMTWNEFKALLVEEFCPSNEMEKFHELAKLVPHLVIPESSRIKRYIAGLAPEIRGMLRATQPTTIQNAIPRAGILTDEAVSCGTLTKGNDKRRVVEESRNKLALEANRNNRSNGNQVRGRAFNVKVNAMEAVQDPNIVTGTFSLNDHFVTVLFDSRADFSFISTKFAPLLNVKPSIANPGYVIEVADGKKVEVDSIFRDCKLELGSSLFSINLIPLGYGSFDMIVGMDWLSQHKAVIVCPEKVEEIAVEDGNQLALEANCNNRSNGNQVRGRDFNVNVNAMEAVQDPNVVTGTFSLNDHFVIVLFDSGADFSFKIEENVVINDLVQICFRRALFDFPSSFVHVINERSHPWIMWEIGSQSIECDHLNEIGMVIELFSDYECEIRYYPSKANFVADALSREERLKPRRIRAMAMTIQTRMREKIQAAQSEAFKQENILAECMHGLDQQMEKKEDESLYFMDRIWVPLVGGVRTVIMEEAHKSKYFVHPGADKMYNDLRDMYWWPGMKKDIATEDYSTKRLANVYIDEIVALHGVPVSIISDRDGRFTSRCWQTVQKSLGTRLDMSTAYHPKMDGQSERTIQTLEDMLRACVIDFALYGRKCRSPILWAEIGESSLIGPELVQEMTAKVMLIKEKLKAARDRQKSYVDNRRKPLEFEVGDRVMLKVSPWKCVICFGKKGKLAPRYVGPFEILERIGPVAYRLRLLEELSGVHDTFHVSNLKKCLADASLHVPLDEIRVDKTLHFIEEPIEIMDREVKRLKHSRISLVKVR